ncbi:MAG: hypothetical protein LLG06_03355 [Desulfobacteraceae bacterium]|nr:hypothetical protein [Desulfobacteraceae bacterium]
MSRLLDTLSQNQLQTFVAGLSGLAPEEMRKAKVLYIKNAISEYRAVRDSYKAAWIVQVLFMLVPLFWPILYLQRKAMRAEERLFRERISNAVEVWKDDLRGEQFAIDETETVTSPR